MASKAGPAAGEAQVPMNLASGRRMAFIAVVLALLCAVCAPFFVDIVDHDAPQARGGVISYAGYGPLTAPVELKGDWRMTWLIPPHAGAQIVLPVPGPWQGPHPGAPTLPEAGAASYSLTLKGLPPGHYSLYVPKMYAGSQVAVNGQVMSERGKVGLTPQTSRTLVRSHEVPVEVDGSDLQVRIDLSNFQHRDNGIMEAPVLGLSEPMSRWIVLDWMRSLLLVASLLLLACYGLVIFLFRPQDRASLYMAIGCVLLLPLAALMSRDNLFHIAFPGMDFRAMLTIQYLTSTAALWLAMAYTNELFPRESPKVGYWLVQGLNGLRLAVYAALATTGDMVLLSHVSQYAAPFRAVILVYILGIVIAAVVRRRDGAVIFLFGLGAFFLSVIYTDLASNVGLPAFLGVNLLPIGALLLLFSQMVLLAERWSISIAQAEQTNTDLRRLLDVNISISSEMQLEALLTKIVQVTSKVIQADRTSLFLHDPKTDELWSVVAEGVQERQIRFPADTGLAGWVFTHGEAVNLADAYSDPRFNRGVDTETGYRTRSVLAVPVTTRDGRRVGVMQALNRQTGPSFGDADVERMSAFAAQAAIAIENATLFTEVAAERNYNESILLSMTNGVVTLDADGRVAKLNEAAARILELPADAMAGADAKAWLAEQNPALLAEVEAVSAGSGPKTLVEVDLRTGRGRTIAANVSIVPLVGEGQGLLILFEDITARKRMQGAMRRFMTQKVVDQVMDHDQDLLFGTACRASVLFADIRNFTALAETLQPRETVDMLNEVYTDLFEAVSAHDGVLDKFLGDAIMAVYGAPIATRRDPQNAVESAVAMMGMVEALNVRRGERGREPLSLGVGIATGEVVAGTIGSPKRMDYTVIGDSVNLAARLQQTTKLYQVSIVICETTAAEVEGAVPLRELDTIRVRGRQQAAKLFQVLTGPADAFSPALDLYRRGRDLMERRRWREAVAAFEAAVVADPADRPSQLMLDRARILVRKPPAADWDGVWDSAEAA